MDMTLYRICFILTQTSNAHAAVAYHNVQVVFDQLIILIRNFELFMIYQRQPRIVSARMTFSYLGRHVVLLLQVLVIG